MIVAPNHLGPDVVDKRMKFVCLEARDSLRLQNCRSSYGRLRFSDFSGRSLISICKRKTQAETAVMPRKAIFALEEERQPIKNT
jgi:hypothetical protein